MMLIWGGDPFVHMWKVPGGQSYVLMSRFWRELGINRISIQPQLNHTSGTDCEKWIPVLPNNDGALSLGIAYTWISEGTYDQDYLDTHSVGFDEWKAYVMGDEDGIPKTPAWASEWCGVPEWTIKALAREWAKKVTSIWHIHGGGKLMGHYSHEPMRMECCLLGMQGWGAPGRHQVMVYHLMNMPPSTRLGVSLGGKRRTTGAAPEARAISAAGLSIGSTVPANSHNPTLNAQMLKEAFYGEYHEYYQGSGNRKNQFPPNKLYYPVEGCSVIHAFWCDRPTLFNDSVGAAEQFEALQSPNLEFMVSSAIWAEDNIMCSDIILPSCTKFENYDITTTSGPYMTMKLEPIVIPPLGESKTDLESALEVAKKWGYYDQIMQGRTFEDWCRLAFDENDMGELISWEDLEEKGYYVVQDTGTWQEAKPRSYPFWEDPVANPLSTPSGLLEYESLGIKEHFPDDKERPPVPNWVIGGPPEEGWLRDESLFGPTAEKYPLQSANDVPRWRYHHQHDDIPWCREIYKTVGFDGYWYETFWISPEDAAARGIVEGDICKIYNDRATILAGAHVTEKQMPRGITNEHGARTDWIIPGKVDRGGSTNLLCPSGFVSKNAAGQLFQNVAVEVEKVTGEQWDEWRTNYPDAFKKPYDPAMGVRFTAHLAEGGSW
jgi:trimethylamine-N-oxide reductase (cytochrome c)